MNPDLLQYLRDFTSGYSQVALQNPLFSPQQVLSQVQVEWSSSDGGGSSTGSGSSGGGVKGGGKGGGGSGGGATVAAFTSKLVQRCVDPESDGTAFIPWRGEVALLFVDLSGYSKAASLLAPKGAHALSAVVNGYFSSIVECVVKKHGGDILTFAGDALMAVWPQDIMGSEGAQECCYSAILCAEDLQANHGIYPIPDSSHQFRLHVGMTFGEMEVDVFMAPNAKAMQRAFPFMTGDLLMRIGDIVDGAKAGEVAIDAATLELCNGLVHCTALEEEGEKIYRIDEVEADELTEALETIRLDNRFDDDGVGVGGANKKSKVSPKLFIHPAIVRRLQFGVATTQMSEMRFLCVFFIVKDCPTHTADWFLEVQDVLDRNRCPVIQCIDDDKGTHIVAAVNLFRAESHPVDTAIRCAQELVEREVGCVIGLASGDVFCGCVGGEQSTRWDVTGAPCVRACRLMQAAIKLKLPFLTDDSIYSKLRSVTPLNRLSDPINVKGSPQPVTIYELRLGGIVHAADSIVVLGKHRQCYTLHQEHMATVRTILTDNGTQRPVVAINGTIASGKRSLCKIALGNARHVLFEHTSMPNSAPLSVGRTVADWFSHSPDQTMSEYGKACQAALASSHMSKALSLLLTMVDHAISSDSFICLLIHHAQFLDPGSLSFVRAVLQSKRTNGTGQFSVCLTTVPLFGAPTLAEVIRQLHRGVPPQDRRSIPIIELANMTLEDCRALWRKTGIWALCDDCALAIAEKVGYSPGFIPVLQAYLERLYLSARTSSSSSASLDAASESVSGPPSAPGTPTNVTAQQNLSDTIATSANSSTTAETTTGGGNSQPTTPREAPSSYRILSNSVRGRPGGMNGSRSQKRNSSFAGRSINRRKSSVRSLGKKSAGGSSSNLDDLEEGENDDALHLSPDQLELGADISIGRNGVVRFGPRAEIQLRKLLWTEISPEMFSRVALLYDSLDPRLQLLLRVLTALVHNSNLRRMPSVPEHVLIGVALKVSGASSSQETFRINLDELVKYLILHEEPDPKNPIAKRYRFRLPALEESVFRLLTPDQRKTLCRHAARLFATKQLEDPQDLLLHAELWARANIPDQCGATLEKAWSAYLSQLEKKGKENTDDTESTKSRSNKNMMIDSETVIFAQGCAVIAESLGSSSSGSDSKSDKSSGLVEKVKQMLAAQTPAEMQVPSSDLSTVPFVSSRPARGGEQSLPLLAVKNFTPPLALGPIAGYSAFLALGILPESVRVVGADPRAISNPPKIDVQEYMRLVRMFEMFVPLLSEEDEQQLMLKSPPEQRSLDVGGGDKAGSPPKHQQQQVKQPSPPSKNNNKKNEKKSIVDITNTGEEASLMQEEVLMLAAVTTMQSTDHADMTAVELLEYFQEISEARALRVKKFAKTRDAQRLVRRATAANPELADDLQYNGLVKAYDYLVDKKNEFKGDDEEHSLSKTDFEVALMDLATVGFDFMHKGLTLEGFQLHELRNSVLREHFDIFDFLASLFLFILDRSNAAVNYSSLRQRGSTAVSDTELIEKRNLYDIEKLGTNITIVVGGSQAGLCAAYCLKKQGLPYVCLERAKTVAATWISRWDSFRLVTPNYSLLLPGYSYKDFGAEGDDFMTKTTLLKYFESYRKKFDLDVRFNIRVVDCTQKSDGNWAVKADVHGTIRTFACKSLILAVGGFHSPKIPRFSSKISPDIVQLHSSQYKNPRQLVDGAVLIVGCAQSGVYIGTELCETGKKVFISCGRRSQRIPYVRGQNGLFWVMQLGLFETITENLPPDVQRTKRMGPNGCILPGRSVSMRTLAKKYDLTMVGRLKDMNGYQVELEEGLADTMKHIESFPAVFSKKVEDYIAAQREKSGGVLPDDLKACEGVEDIVDETEITPARCELDPILKMDLRKQNIKNIIWCTGFTPSFDQLVPGRPELFDENGYPEQSRGVAASSKAGAGAAGLYYLGLHWMYKWKSAILYGIGEDAEYVAEHIKKQRAAAAGVGEEAIAQ